MAVQSQYKEVLAALLETFFPLVDRKDQLKSCEYEEEASVSLQIPVHLIPEVLDEVSSWAGWFWGRWAIFISTFQLSGYFIRNMQAIMVAQVLHSISRLPPESQRSFFLYGPSLLLHFA